MSNLQACDYILKQSVLNYLNIDIDVSTNITEKCLSFIIQFVWKKMNSTTQYGRRDKIVLHKHS